MTRMEMYRKKRLLELEVAEVATLETVKERLQKRRTTISAYMQCLCTVL